MGTVRTARPMVARAPKNAPIRKARNMKRIGPDRRKPVHIDPQLRRPRMPGPWGDAGSVER